MLLLSILCLGIVFVGGWHFQYSIIELSTLVADQQETIMEHKKEIASEARKWHVAEKVAASRANSKNYKTRRNNSTTQWKATWTKQENRQFATAAIWNSLFQA